MERHGGQGKERHRQRPAPLFPRGGCVRAVHVSFFYLNTARTFVYATILCVPQAAFVRGWGGCRSEVFCLVFECFLHSPPPRLVAFSALALNYMLSRMERLDDSLVVSFFSLFAPSIYVAFHSYFYMHGPKTSTSCTIVRPPDTCTAAMPPARLHHETRCPPLLVLPYPCHRLATAAVGKRGIVSGRGGRG